jgi:hypothetical protein
MSGPGRPLGASPRPGGASWPTADRLPRAQPASPLRVGEVQGKPPVEHGVEVRVGVVAEAVVAGAVAPVSVPPRAILETHSASASVTAARSVRSISGSAGWRQ